MVGQVGKIDGLLFLDILGGVGPPCFDSLANQKTRQHQNQSLELQDLVLLFSERDLSKKKLQRFILCALSIGFRLVIKCRCLFVWLDGKDTTELGRSRKDTRNGETSDSLGNGVKKRS